MSVVAIHTSSVPVVIQQRALGGVVRIRRCREWMPHLWRSVFSEDINGQRLGSDVCAVVARDTVLLIGSAKQSRRSLGIMRRMAGNACILRNCRVASNIRCWRDLTLHQSVGTRGPIRKRVHLAGHLPGRIVAG